MVGDKIWLRDNLVKALGWDLLVAEEVVEALAAAQSQQERDDLVQVEVSYFLFFWYTDILEPTSMAITCR